MKVLVVGLGSMGKRRIRCLKTLGQNDLYGFDTRLDRAEEASSQGIKIVNNVEDFFKNRDSICVISTPPDLHKHYIDLCSKYQIKFFVEASVLMEDLEDSLRKNPDLGSLGVPSCTLLFHPAIKNIQEVIKSGKLGKLSTMTYHSGQYLPDWHPYEKVSEYYVSNKKTGGAREIVPFELSWICKVFDFPEIVKAFHDRTIEIKGAESIDDSYLALMSFKNNFFLSLTVDVVSRKAIRTLVINGSAAQLKWSWENDYIEINYDETNSERLSFVKDKSHEGYNKNITESMYVEEVKSFLDFTSDVKSYPSSLDFDLKVLQLLSRIECA